MALAELDTLDRAGFDRFRMDLIAAGFEPVPGTSQREWIGPVPAPLRRITDVKTVTIRFQDGWPFRPPDIFIPGADIRSEHFQRGRDVVCLWQDDDSSGEWLTFAGVNARISDWVERYETGFERGDAMLDAHRYFNSARPGIATLDLAELQIEKEAATGATGKLTGTWNDDQTVLELSRSGGDIEGRWYYHERRLLTPPHTLEEFREALVPGQRNNLDRRIANVVADGRERMVMLLWQTDFGRNALVLTLTRANAGRVGAQAIEFAPSDTETLRLRCGPDAGLLICKHVTILGAGAIGSHVSVLLAQAGLGSVRIIDTDVIRPGNVVRHHSVLSVGTKKTTATSVTIALKAPWTNVETRSEKPWSSFRISELIDGTDMVIDATGFGRFAGLVARVAANEEVPLVSTALYRGGSVGRVRRQVPERDTVLYQRTDEALFPTIPPADDPPTLEAGCGARVNNASPIAVSCISAVTAEIVIDAIAGRFHYGEETVDVYRPLDTAPFNQIGRLPLA